MVCVCMRVRVRACACVHTQPKKNKKNRDLGMDKTTGYVKSTVAQVGLQVPTPQMVAQLVLLQVIMAWLQEFVGAGPVFLLSSARSPGLSDEVIRGLHVCLHKAS